MLVGRSRESRTLDRALAQAAAGRSVARVLVGRPGIGKTALLDDLATRTREAGWQVLEARGHEQEGWLPYAGLHAVLGRRAADLDALPTHLRAALHCALGLEPGPAPPPFLVASATLQAIGLLAARAPLLLLVDDLQWLDDASTMALLFTVRRLRQEPVATVAGVRAGSPTAAAVADLVALPLEELGPDDAHALLRSAVPDLAEAVAGALVARCGGNPLALLQSSRALSPSQRSGLTALDVAGAGEARVMVARSLAAAGAASRLMALVVALEPGLSPATARAAAASLGLGPEALGAAVDRGLLVAQDGSLAVAHPLIAAVLVEQSLPGARQQAHLALAGAIRAEAGVDPWRPVWHQGHATATPSEPHAAELESLAGIARDRGDLPTAARVFEEAAAATPEPEARARRLVEAGECAALAGLPAARGLLERGRETAGDPALRARADRTIGLQAAWHGDTATATSVADRYDERRDPRGAATLHAMAAQAAFISSRPERFRWHTDRAVALARGAPPEGRVVVDLVLAQARSYHGRPDPALTRSVADRFLAAADPDLACPVAEALVHSDEWRTARSVVDAMLPLARARSQVPALTWIQVVNAEVALHDGDLDAATDASVEALTMARAVGLDLAAVQAEAGLAQVDAAAGRATACAARVARVEEGCRAHGFAAPLLYTDLATARLALSQGDGPRAVGLFEAAVRRWDAWGSVGLVVWTALPELVEAQVRARDLDAARATLARLEATPGAGATATGRAWLAHCRLAAARDRDLDGAYEAALGRLEETSHPMLAARTRLVRAERVRRAGRPGDARLAAQEALDRFDALGALLWRERAARELAALGRQAPPPVSSLLHRLTPQERQIAQIAATGASTREIAVALFLSPKTVEHHLTRIYRELGLRSKTELAARLAVGPVSLPRPSP